jgi:NAD+-dependent farnesol dehydrogenase
MGGVFVTGGTGYLGANLVAGLAASGAEVSVLVRDPRRGANLPSKVRRVAGDVTDLGSIRRGMEGCDRAIHAAAHVRSWDPEPKRFEAINVGGLVNVLRAAREGGLSRVLYTSSFIALGPTDGQVADEDWSLPRRTFHNLYERTKAEADAVARREIQQGAPLVILYPGVIYGPGLDTPGNLVGKTIRDFVAGKIPGILGKGDRRFCYAYVSDVVEGHLLALRAAQTGERFILGGENRTLLEFFQELERITGLPSPRRRIPYGLAKMAGRFQRWRAALSGTEPEITDEVVEIYRHEWAYTSRRAQERLGYRITPLPRGLEFAVRALREGDS